MDVFLIVAIQDVRHFIITLEYFYIFFANHGELTRCLAFYILALNCCFGKSALSTFVEKIF